MIYKISYFDEMGDIAYYYITDPQCIEIKENGLVVDNKMFPFKEVFSNIEEVSISEMLEEIREYDKGVQSK